MPDTLAEHRRYALVRIARAQKLAEQAKGELVDAIRDGTDALSMDEARGVEERLSGAIRSLESAEEVAAGAHGQLDRLTEVW